jgi:hypothetical protein
MRFNRQPIVIAAGQAGMIGAVSEDQGLWYTNVAVV